MQTIAQIIPFVIALLLPIIFLTVPVILFLLIKSYITKDEEQKKRYKKFSVYLLTPLAIFLLLLILWGILGLFQTLN